MPRRCPLTAIAFVRRFKRCKIIYVEWRRGIHQHPELGFKEWLTADFIAAQLTAWGIDHQVKMAETGVVAVIEGTRPGPVLGIRADMDALPIQEANAVPYRSQHDGVMPACGHDDHVAIALGTAHYLAHHHPQFFLDPP